jgi:hypothetical protein
MTQHEKYIEWREPSRSPENREFYVTYDAFIRLVMGMLAKVIPVVACGLAAIIIIFGVKKHVAPIRMGLIWLGFILVMTVGVVLVCHIGYLCTRSVQRHIRLSQTELTFVTLAKKECFSFSEITRVSIESAGNGDHRLLFESARGELCRLRVPAGFDVDSIARLIPEGKLLRRE